MTPDQAGRGALARARRDPGVFAELLLGAPLWDHQLEVVHSPARYRCVAAGRQVGKSRMLAVISLHAAFATPNTTVLLISAGEAASRRLLEEVASLATNSPILRGSIVDDTTQLVTLTNGSTIRSVPASQRQVRGWPVDLLILDEAGFIADEIWRAAEPTIIARPGSRVLLCSSPYGGPEAFFRQLWHRGMQAPDQHLASWHWPSSVSPLVDAELLEQIRQREAPAYFEREYLAVWTDATGTYFAQSEIDDATTDEPMVDPDAVLPETDDDLTDAPVLPESVGTVVGGVDWGMQRDAHALAVVAADGADGQGRPCYRVVWLEERFGLSYEAWMSRLSQVASRFSFSVLSSETNGVGAAPTQILGRQIWEASRRDVVVPVTTTAKTKEDAFGYIQLLLQQKRLKLPRHPSLLRQLAALEYSVRDGGGTRIEVPERAGHDDCAMSLALAVMPLIAGELVPAVAEVVTAGELFDPMEDVYEARGWYATPV